LEDEKLKILRAEEEEWRLKSKALWIKGGDCNTRFFHNFANQRRVQNAIWDIQDEGGSFVNSQQELSTVAASFFGRIFKDPRSTRIED